MTEKEKLREIEDLIWDFNKARGNEDDYIQENALYDWASKQKSMRDEKQ